MFSSWMDWLVPTFTETHGLNLAWPLAKVGRSVGMVRTSKFAPRLRARRGRSIGSFRPSTFLATLCAAGRSVGPDRLKKASKRTPRVGRSGTRRLESTSHRLCPVEAQTDGPALKGKYACIKQAYMTAGSIAILRSQRVAIGVRNGQTRRPRPTLPRPQPERRLACRACESGAAPSGSHPYPPRPGRCRAVRSYGPVRNLTFHT